METQTIEPDQLLSHVTTLELVEKASGGDRQAVESLIQRSLPSLKRWAHGKLPIYARGALDTGDLVQDAAFHAIQRIGSFVPQNVGSVQAYLQRSVINRIRDEVRRVMRRPAPTELPEDLRSTEISPLELAIRKEAYSRYCSALVLLRPRDRAMAIARLETDWSIHEIAAHFEIRSDAARMALKRTLDRLSEALESVSHNTSSAPADSHTAGRSVS